MKSLLLLALLGASAGASAQKNLRAAPAPAAVTAATTVTGMVLDRATGRGLPGVRVVLKGSTLGTRTDAAGHYALRLPDAARAVLRFSAVGFVPVEQAVDGARVLNVALAADGKQPKKAAVTGAGRPRVAGRPVRSDKALKRAAPAAPTYDRVQLSNEEMAVGYSSDADAESGAWGAPPPPATSPLNYPARPEAGAGDTYAHTSENAFFAAATVPLSTFGLDVDNASYANVRRFLNEGQLPPRDAVRVEEMLNYFQYQYPAPPAGSADPVRLSTELAACPWNPAHQLARIGVQARRIETASLPPANLVFLVDVSGSMQETDRLPLVQAGLKLLVQELRPQDHVSLVVYAGAAGLVLPPTPGSQKQVIVDAIDRLQAGGSTAGGAGLRLAYGTARQYFQKEANNRVILASDGDFNVGESSEVAMEQLITTERETGVFLTVLGCGRGNLRDSQMELLADKGNGNYAYLDNLDEARRVLVAQFGGTLFTVAQDAKLQIEFNPARVANYRLVGYENRLLAAEDFNNDRKDAGDLGAGHTVTALYEIVPVGSPQPLIDPLRYSTTAGLVAGFGGGPSGEILTVKLRYKQPQGLTSQLLTQPLTGAAHALSAASPDFRFAAAVAQFGLLLRQSEQRGTATYAATATLAEAARGTDADGYRAEFVRLVRLAEGLSGGGVGMR